MLAAPVDWLRRLRVPRVLAVGAVVTVAFALLGALTVLVFSQVVDLAKNLPDYQQTIQEKIRGLRTAAGEDSLVDRTGAMVQALREELQPAAVAESEDPASAPVRVQVNYVIEPWLYGSSTGLSPVAIILAAIFWTLLWGPVGLILATPLTVCLVTLGRYVPRLDFLEVMLGSSPVLSPSEQVYQRLLADNREEIIEMAEERLGRRPDLLRSRRLACHRDGGPGPPSRFFAGRLASGWLPVSRPWSRSSARR